MKRRHTLYLDPKSILATGRTVATITVPRAPLDLAATPRAVWVTNAGAGGDNVARIDPRTNRLVGRPVGTGASPQSLAVGGGSLWWPTTTNAPWPASTWPAGKWWPTSQSRLSRTGWPTARAQSG
jgi:DNA-binding beta-propeller fold protein YncE